MIVQGVEVSHVDDAINELMFAAEFVTADLTSPQAVRSRRDPEIVWEGESVTISPHVRSPFRLETIMPIPFTAVVSFDGEDLGGVKTDGVMHFPSAGSKEFPSDSRIWHYNAEFTPEGGSYSVRRQA